MPPFDSRTSKFYDIFWKAEVKKVSSTYEARWKKKSPLLGEAATREGLNISYVDHNLIRLCQTWTEAKVTKEGCTNEKAL